MSSAESQRAARHASQRRLKKFLRYAPRRAVFHRYPIVGRFAAVARRRAYLWSFKRKHVRPAFYVGSVLSLWPLVGVQMVLAFAASLIMRTNFMVTGALQFITNPFTVAPIYYFTYLVGKYTLELSGFWQIAAAPAGAAPAPGGEKVTIALAATETLPRHFDWASGFGSAVMALFVGGTICGLLLGLILDLLYMLGWRLEQKVHHGHHSGRPKSRPGA